VKHEPLEAKARADAPEVLINAVRLPLAARCIWKNKIRDVGTRPELELLRTQQRDVIIRERDVTPAARR
jgi:hypothetical protein